MGVSPSRHESIHGTVQVRGSPPLTSCANSRSGRGRRPGASETMTRPRTSTCGTMPEAHCVAAVCAARRPRMFDLAVRTTRAGAEPGGRGHPWSAARHSGTRAARLDSPAPPCTPSHHRSAGWAWSYEASWSARSGLGTPRCGATGPVGGRTALSVTTGTACSGSVGRESHGLLPSDTTRFLPDNGSTSVPLSHHGTGSGRKQHHAVSIGS